MTNTRNKVAPTAGSQTLARGLRALEILAEAEQAMTLNELTEALGVHRSNAYRVLRTLEEHRLVLRDEGGDIRLGPRLTMLARGVAPGFSEAAQQPLADLANELGATAFVTVLDAQDIITLVCAEPVKVTASVSRKPGTKHSVFVGAPGHAIEASLTERERTDRFGSGVFTDAAERARQMGYSISRNEVIHGVTALAVPVRIPGEPPAALAVVHFSLPDDIEPTVMKLRNAVEEIKRSYR